MGAIVKEKEILLNSAQLARKLNISACTVWRWKRDGKLPPYTNLNGRPVWKLADIESWLSTQADGGEV
ncbi:MAG: helix-turn-helix transcriptional regulator [Candidatus Nitrosoglobus sp.]